MQAFTFKIKKGDYSETLYALHCPYDVLYDSVKNSEFLKGHGYRITHEEISADPSFSSVDIYDGDVDALFDSKDIKEWLLNPRYGEVNNDGNDE